MTNNIKEKPAWKTLGFKSEWEYRKHLGKQKRVAQKSGFTPYSEHQKTLAKDKLNILIRGLEESAESCSTMLPYYVPVVMRHLNTGIHEDNIDGDTYHKMLDSIKSSTDIFEKKCNCSGKVTAPIRDVHTEEFMERLRPLKDSVESCRSDAPSMTFVANKSLGAYAGYRYNKPIHLNKDLMEILNIAVEFKGCSCKR
jgi:hypothetical protein